MSGSAGASPSQWLAFHARGYHRGFVHYYPNPQSRTPRFYGHCCEAVEEDRNPAKPGKMTYYFGQTRTDGKADQRQLLGGKGANLADMTSIGLPVPPGFTITTAVCDAYYKTARSSRRPDDEVKKSIAMLEKELGKKFGDKTDPLLMSVRSGAAASMPGMMNTILNLGLNDDSVVGLANATKNERFAYDSYRRLINMYGDVVVGVDHEHFEEAFDTIKKKYKAKLDTDVPTQGLIELCDAYKPSTRSTTASRSRKTRSNNSKARSKPSSHPGCRSGRSPIAKWKTSPASSAPR